MRRALLLILIVCFSPSVWASESLPLMQNIRAQAMGGAVVAISSEEQALFFNPAALAENQKISFRPASVLIEGSQDLISNPKLVTQAVTSGGNLSQISGLFQKNEYARVQSTSLLLLPRFGIAALGDLQSVIRLKNPANPTGVLGAVGTYGVQAGYGATLYSFPQGRGEVRLGLSMKYLNRLGTLKTPTLTDILTLNFSDFMNAYSQSSSAWGWDLGSQLIYHSSSQLSWLAGISAADLANTRFSGGASEIPFQVSAGVGMRFRSKDFSATLAYDMKRIFDPIDWRKKVHLGLELKLPAISLYAGLNQIWPSYGAALNLKIFRLTYANYTEELASVPGINPENRHLLSLEFLFDL